MDKFLDSLLWALKLYTLTLVLPIAMTIMVIFGFIVGMESQLGILGSLESAWVGYYITGTVADLEAWRIHLGLFFLCFLFFMFSND